MHCEKTTKPIVRKEMLQRHHRTKHNKDGNVTLNLQLHDDRCIALPTSEDDAMAGRESKQNDGGKFVDVNVDLKPQDQECIANATSECGAVSDHETKQTGGNDVDDNANCQLLEEKCIVLPTSEEASDPDLELIGKYMCGISNRLSGDKSVFNVLLMFCLLQTDSDTCDSTPPKPITAAKKREIELLSGTHPVMLRAAELRKRALPKGSFVETAFQYVGETVRIWDFFKFWTSAHGKSIVMRSIRREARETKVPMEEKMKRYAAKLKRMEEKKRLRFQAYLDNITLAIRNQKSKRKEEEKSSRFRALLDDRLIQNRLNSRTQEF